MDKRSDWMVGLIVKVKTSLGEEIEGEIFSFDSTTNSVVLFESLKHTNIKKNWRILKTSFISEVQYIGKADTVDLELEPPPVDITKIRKQENKAIKAFQEEVSRIGVGVSEEAQELFNALARTLPCSWQKDSIVVYGEIIIDSPYTAQNCRAISPESSAALERVKKVLDGERRKLSKNQRKQ